MTEEEKKAAEAAAKKEAEEKAAAEAKAKEEADAKAKAELEAKSKEELLKKLEEAEGEKAKLLKESMGRKESLKSKDDEIAALKAQFEGIDPEAAREALKTAAEAAEAKKQAELKELESKGEYDKILEQVNTANAEKIAEKDKEIETRDSEIAGLKATINKLTVGSSFSSSTFISEQLVLTPTKVEALYGSHFDVEDGAMVAYDKPRGSDERTKLVDDKGAPLGFEAAITKIVSADPDFERMQKSKLKPGAGSTEGDGKDKTQPGDGATGLDRIKTALSQRKAT
jgi:chemotaxis protein histidine kinase CheA